MTADVLKLAGFPLLVATALAAAWAVVAGTAVALMQWPGLVAITVAAVIVVRFVIVPRETSHLKDTP